MITPDTSARFPLCPTFGYIVEPNMLVKIVKREGGYERRQRVWSRPLSVYSTVPSGDQAQADIEDVYNFWQAVGGMANAFRFKDWMDFQSCRLDSMPSATDQPLVSTGNSPPGEYRLIKEYTAGPFTQVREIQRPVGASISISNELGETQDPAHWTIDENTGLLSIGGGFTGTPTAWGGDFDVWVRFDAQLNPSFTNFKVANVTVQLTELRQPL